MKIIAAIMFLSSIYLWCYQPPKLPSIRLTRNGVYAYFFKHQDANKFGLIADDVLSFPRDAVFTSDDATVVIEGQGKEGHPIIVNSQ